MWIESSGFHAKFALQTNKVSELNVSNDLNQIHREKLKVLSQMEMKIENQKFEYHLMEMNFNL